MMNCIFCKQDSSESKSVEHIIPESLGNKTIVLPSGIVCDSCNNYFAVKVEKPLLEQLYFEHLRFNNYIPSKKQRIPKIKGIMGGEVTVERKLDGTSHINVEDELLAEKISSGIVNSMIVIEVDEPEMENAYMSKFLAKGSLETLCLKNDAEPKWIHEIVNSIELDPIRNYARYGVGKFWQYSQRRIYGEVDRFIDPTVAAEPYTVLHELDCVWLSKEKLCFVLVLMGVEYVIDFDGPDANYYEQWLVDNKGVSPLSQVNDRKTIKVDPDEHWKIRYDNTI